MEVYEGQASLKTPSWKMLITMIIWIECWHVDLKLSSGGRLWIDTIRTLP